MAKWIFGLTLICMLCGCAPAPAETATVSLILYSGMPDPTWELTAKQAREFARRMDALPFTPVGEETSHLGYRGIYVFLGNRFAPSQTIRVTNGEVIVREGDEERWYYDAERQLERWLLETGQLHLKDAEYALALNSFSPGFAIHVLEVSDEPLIAIEDVVRYNPADYALTLTEEAFARYNALDIPVQGIPFYVTVYENVIYEGTFCTPISSLSNQGIVIEESFLDEGPVLHFQLGYPESPDLFEGEDLRNAAEILEAFRLVGKLEE